MYLYGFAMKSETRARTRCVFSRALCQPDGMPSTSMICFCYLTKAQAAADNIFSDLTSWFKFSICTNILVLAYVDSFV